MSRRLRTLAAAIGIAALAWLLFATLERALALAQRFMSLPEGLRWLIGGLLAVVVVAGAGSAVWLLRPRKRRAPVTAPDRASLESRLAALRDSDTGVEELRNELDELDRRRASASLYLAVFGEISTGKSTLIAALVPGSAPVSDVRGGTTRQVTHYEGHTPAGEHWTVADVPGSAEAGGDDRERVAREEALRAHAVLYVCAGDLTRTQATELHWLGDFGKPLVLVVNKADQWTDEEREHLVARLRERSEGIPDAIVLVSAGGEERFTRVLADGSREEVRRTRRTDLGQLPDALRRLIAPGAVALEGQRENAVLASLHERTSEKEVAWRAAEAERIVRRYARRAIVGAMAAVAPGTDLVIQGALAAGLVRALAGLYGVRVTDVEIEGLLRQARLTLRTGTSVVLAVAGNALKAFPGLGTLGGGVLHAFAYALIFDSLGRALAASLAERQALDQTDAGARMRDLLADAGSSRLRQLAELTGEALRDR
ncbi:GTP-binding protein HSR1 [Luteibacter rhizovicinus DSM 16549]|uniref:GTP-binding protein HSR1 n=1 Tax=Luteibacter rhizovicinus DSM 16549 TaxID=1440763 RepID=A0A0G9HFR3_9GAMM|nr:GTPase [Luteibacter rhizovicinus]APG02893.1 GTP-binding protein HSR1 [Luteibacter rhizovicinus DSM 16549]KLD68563.1 GTP-binding protein HSR1 [Luteibacter rhizovicinus DSM 16549]KLD79720.1 GTP-binding protein HSR1 [Xanthomonas hyacinthi DSM 19077]